MAICSPSTAICSPARAAEAAEDDADEAPVHGLAHDVAEDRTRGAHERADHDQQVIAEREADRRRRPARVAVQHRDDHGHVRAADPHDQVIADEEAQERQQHQRPGARPAEIEDQQEHRARRRRRVQHVPARKLLGRRVDLERQQAGVARQLAIGHDRAGEGHRADPDAEHQFDPQDADLDPGLLADQFAEVRQRAQKRVGLLAQRALGLREGQPASA
jgi:hypothetical protein